MTGAAVSGVGKYRTDWAPCRYASARLWNIADAFLFRQPRSCIADGDVSPRINDGLPDRTRIAALVLQIEGR